MVSQDIWIIALAGFCSGLIKTGVGVGAGIFLLPTLALAFPAKIALGLGAPLMLASDIIGLRMYWKQWLPWPDLKRFLFSVVPGLIVGIVLLPHIPGPAFRMGVGLFGACYALCMLWRNFPLARILRAIFSAQRTWNTRYGMCACGFMGGVATVIAHAGGLVWSLYLITAATDRRMFVGTTIIIFFLTNISKLISYLYINILDGALLCKVIPALPLIFLGSYVGNILNKHCNQQFFKKIVLCCLLGIALCLMF